MDKKKLFILSIALMLCLVPIAFALTAFQGLPTIVASALTGAGVTSVAVGAVVVAGGYVVYHYGSILWKYYFSNRYSTVDSHAYMLHGSEFPGLTKTQFDDKCKQNQNSATTTKYWQYSDNRLIAYNPSTQMLTVGETNGQLVVTCFKANLDYVLRQVTTGRWLQARR